jgi:hypothetical protein
MATTKAPLAKPQRDDSEAAATEDAADAPISANFADAVKKLLKRGKDRGYVTVDEMNAALPQDRVSSEQIEDVLAQMSELGINVVESDDAEEDNSSEEAADYGRTDDPVRLYLREMGAVELLSREGEIAIAKRIEAGREMMISGICESPLTIQAILDWNDALKEGRLLLRDIVDLEAMQEGDSDLPAAVAEGSPEAEEPTTAEPVEGAEGEGADIGSFDDEDNVSLAAVEEKLKPQVIETFDAIASTYKKLDRALRNRAEALAKGEAPAKGADDKIMGLKTDLVDLVRTVRFNNARLEQLVQQLYTLNRRLMGLEGKILRLAIDCGLTREEFLERYYGHELDPNFYDHILLEPPPPPPPPKPSEMTERDRLIAGAVVRRERPLTRAEAKRLEAEQRAAAKQAEKDRKVAEREAKKQAKISAKEAERAAKETARIKAAEQREKERLRKEAEREKLALKREKERAKKEAAREKTMARKEAERKKKEIARIKKEKEKALKAKKTAQQQKERQRKEAAKKKKVVTKKPVKKKPTNKNAKKPVRKPAPKKAAKKKPTKKTTNKRR